MRVLLVNKFWYPKGGSERYTFLLKYLLEAKGHEVIPFAMDDERNVPTPWSTHFVSHVDFWEAADAAPNQTSLLQKLSRIMWSREAARKIGAVIDEVKPDIAHLQNFTHQISPSILAVLRRRNVPIVWTLHDLDVFRPGYRMPRAWGRRALAWVEYVFHHTILNVYRRNIDCIIAPSRFVADAVRGWGWRGRVEVVPNFIEGIRNQESGIRGQSTGAVFVGRLSTEKGIKDFVEAARRLPAIPFTVIGSGPLDAMIHDSYSMIPNLRWLGALQPDEAQERIAAAAVVVVPSIVPEIAPYVILEAMAAGVPVVASRIGGIPELVREGETGFLVPPRDPAALAKTIEMVYGDGMLRKRLGTRARAICTAEYGPERHYERIIGLFTALCATRGS